MDTRAMEGQSANCCLTMMTVRCTVEDWQYNTIASTREDVEFVEMNSPRIMITKQGESESCYLNVETVDYYSPILDFQAEPLQKATNLVQLSKFI